MNNFKIKSVCFDPWAEKIRRYWKFLGGDECYILLGDTNSKIYLIPKKDQITKKKVYGLLFSKPVKIPEIRNILWHEMGHIKGKRSGNKVLKEFYADKWAIETASKKGFTNVVEEIILRCSDFCIDKNSNPTYSKAAVKIIRYFKQIQKSGKLIFMYFFASDIELIPYGWIRGFCRKGDYYETGFKWLSQYCKFFPPLFVSLDQNKLTGYSHQGDKILFGFKEINGFPIKYDEWMMIVGILINLDTNNFRYIDEKLVEGLKELQASGYINLSGCANLDEFLKKRVFVEKDQFVVNSLDLRKSSVIISLSEIQKSSLIRKGFPANSIKVVSSFSRLTF